MAFNAKLRARRNLSIIGGVTIAFVSHCAPDHAPRSRHVNLSIAMPNADRMRNREFERMAVGAPNTITDFNCFAVNISGTGISAPTDLPAGTCFNALRKSPGVVGGFAPIANGQLDLLVPPGPARTVELYFLKSTGGGCPKAAELFAAGGALGDSTVPYFVASTTLDIFADVTVGLSPQFAPAGAVNANWFCQSGQGEPSPTPTASTLPNPITFRTVPTVHTNENVSPVTIDFDVADTQATTEALSASLDTVSDEEVFPATSREFTYANGAWHLRLIPATDLDGPQHLTVSFRDPQGASASQSFDVVIHRPANSPPSARAVFGQSGFSQSQNMPLTQAVSGPKGMFAFGDKLYVVDTANHRVLVAPTSSANSPISASTVLGQGGNFGSANAGPGPMQFSYPLGIATDGTSLAISDSGNNRVLVWHSLAAALAGAGADAVIGQSNFGAGYTSQNAGGSLSSDGHRMLNGPNGLAIYNNHLLVADTGNNRVLIFADLHSIVTYATAVNVLGQADYASTTNSCTESVEKMAAPTAVAVSPSGAIAVADTSHHRVLYYAAFPNDFDSPATPAHSDQIFGQGTQGDCIVNAGTSIGASGLYGPAGVAFNHDGTKLFVADGGNNRVVWYTDFSGRFGKTAAGAYGTSDLATVGPSSVVDRKHFGAPYSVSTSLVTGGQEYLWVLSPGQNRALRFPADP